jgi:nitrilase
MGDEYPTIKAAAVQAASVFLDREASTEKACQLIREAGAGGARIVGFPEGFIPAHPIWFHFHPGTGPIGTGLSVELFKNAVEIPGPQIDRLRRAAEEARVYAVVGVCEKQPNTIGTLHNTQVFIGPDGSYLGKHQKLMPTVGERLVHAGGNGDTLGAFQTDFGPATGLICGENSNPLAVFTMVAQHSRVHVMSWPNHFPTVGAPLRERVRIDSQAFAQMTKAFVISACGTVDEAMIDKLELTPEDAAKVRDEEFCGGSMVVAPDSTVIAGPMGAEEGVLYADLDLELGVKMKLRHDFAGHYNRPDIFQLHVNGTAPRLLEVESSDAQPRLGNGGQQVLGEDAAQPTLTEGEAEAPPEV